MKIKFILIEGRWSFKYYADEMMIHLEYGFRFVKSNKL